MLSKFINIDGALRPPVEGLESLHTERLVGVVVRDAFGQRRDGCFGFLLGSAQHVAVPAPEAQCNPDTIRLKGETKVVRSAQTPYAL